MTSRRPIRVYPNGDAWVVKQDGKTRAAAIKRTKKEALEKARDLAYSQDLTVIVHGSDGKIQRTFRTKDKETDGDCLLTTACTRYYQLSDDCYELTMLRAFRDSFMCSSVEGVTLVDEYYSRAPSLVRRIAARSDKATIYEEVWRRIRLSCVAIEQGRMHRAQKIYTEALYWLESLLR